MKKTALSNNDGLIPLTFDIPADAQTLQVVVRKTQTFMFKSTLLRRALETIANVCEAVLFSLWKMNSYTIFTTLSRLYEISDRPGFEGYLVEMNDLLLYIRALRVCMAGDPFLYGSNMYFLDMGNMNWSVRNITMRSDSKQWKEGIEKYQVQYRLGLYLYLMLRGCDYIHSIKTEKKALNYHCVILRYLFWFRKSHTWKISITSAARDKIRLEKKWWKTLVFWCPVLLTWSLWDLISFLSIFRITWHDVNGVTLHIVSWGTLYSLCPFLPWQVKAEEGKERLESPETSIRAERYQSATRDYLSISIPHTVLAPGDTLRVILNAIHQSGSGKIDYFYYMVNRIVAYQ